MEFLFILLLPYIFWRRKSFLGRWKEKTDNTTLNLRDALSNLSTEERTKRFNLDLLKELLRQAELKVQNEDARKQRIDSRAYQIIGVSMAIMMYIIDKIFYAEVKSSTNILFTVLALIYFSVLIIILFDILTPKKYAALGSRPSYWLFYRKKSQATKEERYSFDQALIEYKDYSTADNNLSQVLMKSLRDYDESLAKSQESNDHRLKTLHVVLELASLYFVILPIFTIYGYVPNTLKLLTVF
jgi:hypothetical protein